jgi:hypothetical protein
MNRFKGSRFRVQGSGFKGSRLRLKGFGAARRVQGSEVQGSEPSLVAEVNPFQEGGQFVRKRNFLNS